MLNQSKNLIKIIGIGDFACQTINKLFEAGIPNTDFFVCHSRSEILENSKVSGKIKLSEDLKNFSGSWGNTDQNLKDLFQATTPAMVFFLADLSNEWNQNAATLLAQLANKKDQLTIAILASPKAKGGYYAQWDTDPTRFIDAIFHFENNELTLNNEQHYDKNKFTSFAKEIIETFTTITDQSATIALDTYDLETMLKGSSNVLIGKATADSKDRAIQVVKNAFKEDMKGYHKALLFIQSGSIEVTMNEVGEMTDYLQSHIPESTTIMWGSAANTLLGNNIKATIITSK